MHLLSGLLAALATLASPQPADPPVTKSAEKGRIMNVLATEYYSVPERWFAGKKVRAPGLQGHYRVDWLYSAKGVSMQGDGIADDGRHYHLCDGFKTGWVQKNGKPTKAAQGFKQGSPFWRAGYYWLNRRGQVTFPLKRGWHDGLGRKFIPIPSTTRFCPGSSRKLVPYQTLAVDPKVIPLGSRVFISHYRQAGLGNGWFVARDTGGAIKGKRVDVYVKPPVKPFGPANKHRLSIRVVPPARAR